MIEKLKDRLKDQWNSNAFRNYFSRPMKTDQSRLLISHYLQSSVAEMSILMFSRFCNEHKADPLFVIHDALIIDANESLAKKLMIQKDFCFKFEDSYFPATITEIS